MAGAKFKSSGAEIWLWFFWNSYQFVLFVHNEPIRANNKKPKQIKAQQKSSHDITRLNRGLGRDHVYSSAGFEI